MQGVRGIVTGIILVPIVLGCSPNGPVVGRVSGVLLLDGKPMQTVLVTFQPADGRPATGITNAEGKFELDFVAGQKGCLVGSNDVFLRQISRDEISADWPAPAKVPPQFGQTFQTVEVKEGTNEFKFDLTSRKK